MKKFGNLLIMVALVAGSSLMNGCKQEEVPVDAKTKVTDYLKLLNAFTLSNEEEFANTESDDLKSAELATSTQLADCLTVIIHENEDGAFWPRSWTFDYGTENCECFYSGNTKRGKIHVTLSDWWRNEGSQRKITFEDFYLNDNKLEGIKTILNTGLNDNGNLTFTRKIDDGRLTWPDGSQISWQCEKISELIEGGDSFRFADDVWSVTGSGSGRNQDGKDYTMAITSPLIYHNGCFYPVSGTIQIKTEGESAEIIDYGNGECDDVATVTVNGEKATIKL